MTKLSELTVGDCERHNQPLEARRANRASDGIKTATVAPDKTCRENYLDGVSFDYFYQLLSDHVHDDDDAAEFMAQFNR